MFAIRQKAVRHTGKLAAYRTLSRYSTGTNSTRGSVENHSPGTDTGHGHQHAGPKNESLGIQLYIVLALIPTTYVVYQLSRTPEDGKPPVLSRMIDSFSYYQERWAARNTLHTAMIEQAALDRHLFHNSKGSRHIDLKFPEVFNTGSPYNVAAGQGGINLDKVVAHYQKINSDAEEKKAVALAAKESGQKQVK